MDEQVIVELSRMLLEKRGFQVFTAQNGQQCIDQVCEHRPAMVLMDYMMTCDERLRGLDLDSFKLSGYLRSGLYR